jgi:NADPH-dependent 2,4-dienoyl-CoA reductase/sulfur reductase-like enzyme
MDDVVIVGAGPAGLAAAAALRARGNRVSGRADLPVAVITVNLGGLDSEPWLKAVVRRVLLQILHELVA